MTPEISFFTAGACLLIAGAFSAGFFLGAAWGASVARNIAVAAVVAASKIRPRGIE